MRFDAAPPGLRTGGLVRFQALRPSLNYFGTPGLGDRFHPEDVIRDVLLQVANPNLWEVSEQANQDGGARISQEPRLAQVLQRTSSTELDSKD